MSIKTDDNPTYNLEEILEKSIPDYFYPAFF